MDIQNYKNLETQLLEFENKFKNIMDDDNLNDFTKQNKIIRLLQEYSIDEYKSNPVLQSKIMDTFNNIFKQKLNYNNNLNSLNKDIIKKEKEKEKIKENKNKDVIDDKKLIDLNLDVILKRTKDTILEVLDEYLENKLTFKDLFKDNRGFFLGVSIILTLLLLYFFYILLTDDNSGSSGGGGIHINYNN